MKIGGQDKHNKARVALNRKDASWFALLIILGRIRLDLYSGYPQQQGVESNCLRVSTHRVNYAGTSAPVGETYIKIYLE